MKFLKINNENILFLKDFINSMGSSAKKFRYYSKRSPELSIKNHIVTYLLFEKDSVSYGHLDKDEDKVWLGLCTKEGHYGKGYGKRMMQKLIDSYQGDIYLSVDIDNQKAIHVYKMFDFEILKETENIIYMRRKNDTSI
ncbi:MAG TPA: hypothetical protein DCM40_46205 [Maribacter sp.]|nr:hypothetical protein [Maribacter sp.]